ncbi:MAG: hypothetical protein WC744_04560 [Patescibacteria group bacterium]|jgi:hypothetical protein
MANKTKVENKVRLLIMLLLSVLLFVFAVIFSQKNIVFNSNSKAREVEICGTSVCQRGYFCFNNKCIKDNQPTEHRAGRTNTPVPEPTLAGQFCNSNTECQNIKIKGGYMCNKEINRCIYYGNQNNKTIYCDRSEGPDVCKNKVEQGGDKLFCMRVNNKSNAGFCVIK